MLNREELIRQIGLKVPSYDEKNNKYRHNSKFIITLPHAVFEGINQEKNIYGKRTQYIDGYFQSTRIDNYIKAMSSLFWKLQNPKNNKSKKILISEDIKEYISNKLLPVFNKNNRCDFFQNNRNLLFSLKNRKIIKQTWTLECLDNFQKKRDILFTIDSIDLWVMDNNICFFVIDTSFSKDQTINISDISSIFNSRMREFKNLSISFKKKVIRHMKGDNNNSFIKSIMAYLLPNNADMNLLNINIADLNQEDFFQVYESSPHAKMISSIHTQCDMENFDINSLISKPAFELSVLEECSYLMGTFSSFPSYWPLESSRIYMYKQMEYSAIRPFGYWNGISLKDSVNFFGIQEGNFLFYNEDMKNEVYFIYMLNLYISLRIKLFEFRLIDEEFSDYNNHVELYQQMQRLKNEYLSDEIARRFLPNELNLQIQKGLQYLGTYREVEVNIKNTLEITKDNLSLLVSISGFFMSVVFVFSDDIQTHIKTFFRENLEMIINYWFVIAPLMIIILIGLFKLKPFVYKIVKKLISKIKYLVFK